MADLSALFDYITKMRPGMLSTPQSGAVPQFGSLDGGFGAPPRPNVNVGVNSRYMPSPLISGSMSAPALGGQLGMEGAYQANEDALPDWSAIMRYRRQF